MRINTIRRGVVFVVAALVAVASCESVDQPVAPVIHPGAASNSEQDSGETGVGTLGGGNAESTTQDTTGRGGVGTLGSGN